MTVPMAAAGLGRRVIRSRMLLVGGIGLLAVLGGCAAGGQGRRASEKATAAADAPQMRAWGTQLLKRTELAFRMPGRDLLAEEAFLSREQPPTYAPGSQPAFTWPNGVQLFALTAAARYDRQYVPKLKVFVDSLDAYWRPDLGVGGYDVLPGRKPLDRYYDDNEWIALGLIEAYQVTQEPKYLSRAREVFRFIQSGESADLGGGIFWHEQKKDYKNTCANGPAIVAALELYRITGETGYQEAARRLYAWVNQHLQDTDGLYFDGVRLDGQVEPRKWSYNSAMMIRANGLWYQITKDKSYLAEAQRIARAAEANWVRPEDGAIKDEGRFAYLLCDAFGALSRLDGNRHWVELTNRALTHLHEQERASGGFYPTRWDEPARPMVKVQLIDQACVARAYLSAETGRVSSGR